MNRRRLDWPARLTALLAMLILDKLHTLAFGHPENTVLGASVYIGTAFAFNAISVFYFSHELKAQVSYDLQRLAFCAMFLNAASWLLYMAQESPSFINFLTKMVTYGMLTRILWVSDGDADSGGWSDLAHRFLNRGRIVHHQEAQQ